MIRRPIGFASRWQRSRPRNASPRSHGCWSGRSATTAPRRPGPTCLAVLARCAFEDRPAAVGEATRRAASAWGAVRGVDADIAVAALTLLSAASARRAGHPDAAVDARRRGLGAARRSSTRRIRAASGRRARRGVDHGFDRSGPGGRCACGLRGDGRAPPRQDGPADPTDRPAAAYGGACACRVDLDRRIRSTRTCGNGRGPVRHARSRRPLLRDPGHLAREGGSAGRRVGIDAPRGRRAASRPGAVGAVPGRVARAASAVARLRCLFRVARSSRRPSSSVPARPCAVRRGARSAG